MLYPLLEQYGLDYQRALHMGLAGLQLAWS